jgi:hypothetical protein
MGTIGVTVLVAAQYTFKTTSETSTREQLAFSNTQTWDSELFKKAGEADEDFNPKLPPPPTNTSNETTDELKTLRTYEDTRTPAQIAHILNEVHIEHAYFGSSTLTSIADPELRPHTYILLRDAQTFALPHILRLKKEYDRVRPSYLQNAIQPALEAPNHPSYPSGHATQAHLIALLLSELDPENGKTYIAAATAIAHNRELAGVHYPSDSTAGRDLAEQIFSYLTTTSDFLEKIEAARSEW